MDIYDFSLRLLASLSAGLVIGFERQWHNKTAGLKTNILVATGAAIFVLLSVKLTVGTSTDVTRIIAMVVSGVGFLGAGVIFREGSSVHGLGSAATIWCSAGIGCLAANGYFMEAAISTLLIVTVNSILVPLDQWLKSRK